MKINKIFQWYGYHGLSLASRNLVSQADNSATEQTYKKISRLSTKKLTFFNIISLITRHLGCFQYHPINKINI